MLYQVWKLQSHPCGTQILPYFWPWARALCQDYRKNGDHDALAETPTTKTATTASWADENNDDPGDEHEYVNTETDKKYRIQEEI